MGFVMSYSKNTIVGLIVGLFIASMGYVLWMGHHQLKIWFNHTRAEIASLDMGKSSPCTPIKSKISPVDGMVEVYVPAGNFTMGSDDRDDRKSNPPHLVHLNAFWVDQTEVSRGMYNVCVRAGACPSIPEHRDPHVDDPAYSNYPVIYIKWQYAQRYCAWAGRKLPTEAEWEKAARGTDGRLFPWGDSQPTLSLANYNNNIGELMPVDRYPLGASPYGALNMAGNAREWTLDWYAPFYYRTSPDTNPTGPETGETKSLRGGSFLDDERQLRVFNRFQHEPGSPGNNRGFRCVESVP
jgi:formylglycine-generating enzyme required for sulfatase activity